MMTAGPLAWSMDPNPEKASSLDHTLSACAHRLLNAARRFMRPGTGFPDYTTCPQACPLTFGFPPGVSAASAELLVYIVTDLFESPRPASWIHILSWGLRRRYGTFQTLSSQILKPVSSVISAQVSESKEAQFVKIRVIGSGGTNATFTFQEYPLPDDEQWFYICTEIQLDTDGWDDGGENSSIRDPKPATPKQRPKSPSSRPPRQPITS